ncbi:MAG: hypothetical protein ABR518_04745 [Actinomycetota bacterium]
MRFELPPDLSAAEERMVIAALETYFAAGTGRPSPWALAGRADGLRLGTLQARHQSPGAWRAVARGGFARRGTETRMGRGDSK